LNSRKHPLSIPERIGSGTGRSCMIAECFLDTNVLLYAASRNPTHRLKKKRAIELIAEKQFALSAQVLQEFYVNATRKADFSMAPEAALHWIEKLEEFVWLSIDSSLVKTGANVSARYGISYWDGAIVAAAEALGVPVLYTEDLNHGQAYGTVTAINPFRDLAVQQGFHDNQQTALIRE
jgi:predicted nucleic acid-binding protein